MIHLEFVDDILAVVGEHSAYSDPAIYCISTDGRDDALDSVERCVRGDIETERCALLGSAVEGPEPWLRRKWLCGPQP
jgi:hypothetical protein